MISKRDMLPLLVQSCPSYADRWQEGCQDAFLDEEGRLLDYVALGDLAHHLVALMLADNLGEFSGVFAVVERLHVEGDSYVREAATIGLLEGIQNIAENAGLDKTLFLRWLGPESRKGWDQLEAFWRGNPSALQE
jgi:hypothetical protein